MPNIADFTPEETTAEIWRDIVILTINNSIPPIFSFVRRQTWIKHNTQQPVAIDVPPLYPFAKRHKW